MPIDLHERLSEFSYGYGATREVELQLQLNGLIVTPFIPSLLHEAKVGFDVAFNRPGAPLLLQFKLGEAMRRFVPGPRPKLQPTFWRYRIDTAEPNGQFEILLKAQRDGADVFYLSPKFHDWARYLKVFEQKEILNESLIVSPKKIRDTLAKNGVPDGYHKVVYDSTNSYLCSDLMRLTSVESAAFAPSVRTHIQRRDKRIGKVLEEVFAGFDDRLDVRRSESSDVEFESHPQHNPSRNERRTLRHALLNRLLEKGRNRLEAIALTVGAEAWSAGAQLIFVTSKSAHGK